MNRSTLQPLLVLALGAGLGHFTAAGRLESLRIEAAAVDANPPSSQGDACATMKNGCAEKSSRTALLSMMTTGVVASSAGASQAGKKPNIVIIWGDDIGQSNISAYTMGMMG